MKKALLILFMVGAMAFTSVGCSPKSDKTEQETPISKISNVKLDPLGIKYITPESWVEYQGKNIFPKTYVTEGTFAHVIYNYITDNTFDSLNDFSKEIDQAKEYLPIFQIVVIEDANVEHENVKKIFDGYGTVNLVGQQQGYSYYILHDPKNVDTSLLTEDEMKSYDELKEAAKGIDETVALFEFDTNLLAELNKKEKPSYISFNSTTLEGEEITSEVFADYDVTLVNFWSIADCYPELDNSQVLQDLYNKFKKDKVNFGVMQIIVDLPAEEGDTQLMAELAKVNVNGQYMSVVMDEALTSFVVNHLEGLPTTYFVNSEGKIIDEAYKGILNADLYSTLMHSAKQLSEDGGVVKVED